MTITALTCSFPYLEPACCSMFSSNCCFLTCIQVSQEAGQVVWYSHLLQNFPQFIVIHTVKGFGILSEAEIDVFLELFCFFNDPTDVGNLISGSSAFSKTSLNIWKFMVHVLLKPGLGMCQDKKKKKKKKSQFKAASIGQIWDNLWDKINNDTGFHPIE